MAPISAVADVGVRAAFTRPDPTGGSQAYWRLDVPSALSVQAVRIARRTTGIGGTPVPGGGQSYVTQTSSGALETASVEDATNVALDGVLERDPATGTYVRFGVRCGKTPAERCAAPGSDAVGIEAGTNVTPVTPPPPPPPPPPGLGPGQAATAGPACAKPRLSVMLSSRPLHTTRGVPVLRANHAYRFTGRLTCVIGGRRASAPRGTV